MTNSHSESTELQENQDRPTYKKLPSDEENEKAVNTSKHRLSVEVELNKGTKESSTDEDSLKDNPLIANGDHGGSLKKLDSSKISINGELNQSKKLDEDEEEEDQDSFMFGMSKLRTFFFFLSLGLLVAFVLVFVFVLPCSESAQMSERTNHITDQAVPGLTSKTGDMDGDGVGDMAYFKNSADTHQRARRDTDNSQTASNCIVDGNSQSCVGQIVIVSTKLGSPIATRSVALVPQISENSLGAIPKAIDCASGGDRKKIVCTFQNSGKYYVVDMKAKSNLTSIAIDGCSKLSMVPVSAKDATSFGFILGCSATDGMKYTFIDGTTLERSELSTQYDASMEPIETTSVTLMDEDGKKATVLATLLRNGDSSVRLSLQKVSSVVSSDITYGKIPLNVGTLLSNESGLDIDIEGIDASKVWRMAFVHNELVLYSSTDVVVLRKEKDKAVLTVQGEIKSVAPSSVNSKPVDNVLMKVCASTTCSFQLAAFDDSGVLTVSKKTTEIHSIYDMPVSFINVPQYKYFTSWYFKETTKPEASETENNHESEETDTGKKEENDDNVVKDSESGVGSENESIEKRSTEENHHSRKEEEADGKECELKWEATLIAYSEKSFSNPMPLYTALLCSEHSVSFIGVTTSNGETMYTTSVNKGPVSSVLTISLPERKVIDGSGGHKFKLSWEDLKE